MKMEDVAKEQTDIKVCIAKLTEIQIAQQRDISDLRKTNYDPHVGHVPRLNKLEVEHQNCNESKDKKDNTAKWFIALIIASFVGPFVVELFKKLLT